MNKDIFLKNIKFWNCKAYRDNNVDLNGKSEDFLLKHVLIHGIKENRNITMDRKNKISNKVIIKNFNLLLPKDFNWNEYINLHSDLKHMNEINAKIHYILYGNYEGREYRRRYEVHNYNIKNEEKENILIIFHIGSNNYQFYINIINFIILNQRYNFYLYCSIADDLNSSIIKKTLNKLSNNLITCSIDVVENYGADCVPYIKYIKNNTKNYDYVIKIHTKKISYWSYRLVSIFDELESLIDIFNNDKSIGIIGDNCYLQPFFYGISETYKNKLNEYLLKENINENSCIDYINEIHKNKINFTRDKYLMYREDIPRTWSIDKCQAHFKQRKNKELIKSGFNINKNNFIKFIAGTIFIMRGSLLNELKKCTTLDNLLDNVEKIKYYSNFDHNGQLFRYTNAYEYLIQAYIYKFNYRVYGFESNYKFNHSLQIKNKPLPSLMNITQESKPSILFISNELSRTGAPLVMKQIINSIKDTYNVYIISIYGGDDVKYYQSLLGSEKVILIFDSYVRRGIDMYREICQWCCKCIQNIKPILVYANTLVSVFGLHAAKMGEYKCRTILHIHEAEEEIFNLYNCNAIIGYDFLHQVDELICVNDYLLYWCRQYLNTRIFPNHHVIYNEITICDSHIDKTTFFHNYNIPIDKKIVGGVGSINNRKGFDVFYELTKLYTNFTFIWASNQTTEDAKRYLNCKELSSNLYIINLNKNEMCSFYKNIDCFLYTSRSEAFPLSLFESLLSKKYVFFHKNIVPLDSNIFSKMGIDPFDGHYNIDNFKKVLDNIENQIYDTHNYDNKINIQFIKSLVHGNLDKIINVINNNKTPISNDNSLPIEISLHDSLNIYQKFKKYVSSNDDLLQLKYNPHFDNCLTHYMNYGFENGRSIYRFPNKLKKTILFALHTLNFNGATKVGLDIASYLQNKFNVVIISWEGGNMIDDYCFENKPIVIRYRKFEHNLIKYIDRKELAENIIKTINCDLVYVNCSCAHDFYHASIECKKPVIYHNHEGEMGYGCELNGFQIPCYNFFNVFPYDRVKYYSPSPETTKCMKDILGVDTNKVKEFQSINFKNILSLSKQSCIKIKKNDRLLFGMIGHTSYRKGYDTFKEIAKHYPQYDFCWVGCNISTEIVEETNNLFLIKQTHNPYKYLVQFDHFLCTTREDLGPIVIIESLYLNIPCHYIKSTISLTSEYEELGSFAYEYTYNIDSFKNIINNISDKKSNEHKQIIENKYDIKNHIINIENDIMELTNGNFRQSSKQNYYYNEEYGYCIYDVNEIQNIICDHHKVKPFDINIYKKKYKNLSYVFTTDEQYIKHWNKTGNKRLNMEIHDWKTYLLLHPEKVKEGIIRKDQIDFQLYENIVIDFDAEKYLLKYPDLQKIFNKDTVINHWINNGVWEGR